MTKYTYNGITMKATDAVSLLSEMHAMSEAPAKTDADWMIQTSRRFELQFGKSLDTSSPESFVKSLEAVKIVIADS